MRQQLRQTKGLLAPKAVTRRWMRSAVAEGRRRPTKGTMGKARGCRIPIDRGGAIIVDYFALAQISGDFWH